MSTLSLLFGLKDRVRRGPYAAWGFGLVALKFLADTGIVYASTGRTWTPLGYVIPSLWARGRAVDPAPEIMGVLLLVAALPFLWIGLSMSIRRAADAGVTPWLGTLFVVPVVNYLVMLALCVLPSVPAAPWTPPPMPVYRQPPLAASPVAPAPPIPSGVRAALSGIGAGIALGVGMLWLCAYGFGTYGVTLFFLTPFTMGAASAVVYNRPVTRGLGATLGVASASVLLAGSVMLLFAIEGVLCLLMAAPIALVVALVGAAIARAIVHSSRKIGAVAPAMLFVLPGVATGEAQFARDAPRKVATSVVVDAPPERVWPHVVGFSEMDEPPDWFFRLGIAYPRRARIEGEGVGAVRRCEFSTGAFVEPITVWEPPSRLAFDVTAQPPSMAEWSPYHQIHAPHLEGYMVSRGGEFDLTRLPGNRTRLEGTTAYTLAIYPSLYWTPYAEAILHAIHRRVLAHIKALSEAPRSR